MALLLLFLAVPLIEITLFIQLGSVLDLGWILLIVILTAILGTYLVRQQGRGVLRQLQNSLSEVRDPTEPLAHGAMILFSGALLLTPGFFTDVVGFLLMVPAMRMAVFSIIRARVVMASTNGKQRPPAGSGTEETIIDGEYTEVELDTARRDKPSGWTRH